MEEKNGFNRKDFIKRTTTNFENKKGDRLTYAYNGLISLINRDHDPAHKEQNE